MTPATVQSLNSAGICHDLGAGNKFGMGQAKGSTARSPPLPEAEGARRSAPTAIFRLTFVARKVHHHVREVIGEKLEEVNGLLNLIDIF